MTADADRRAAAVARAKAWAAANPERARKNKSRWQEKNRDKRLARARAAYAANPAKVLDRHKRNRTANPNYREMAKAWRVANPESQRKREKRWRKANPDKVKAKAKRWRDANPDAVIADVQNRRARSRAAEGAFTPADIRRIRAQQKDICALCPTKLKGRGHRDHIVPLKRGGTNWPSNIQLLCQPCNFAKGAKDPIEFARERGLLL
jgi:5-methylcytosine-specific restriction endonuclease McrA